ncbi:hypothetical protein [Achromobacter kerstersii]
MKEESEVPCSVAALILLGVVVLIVLVVKDAEAAVWAAWAQAIVAGAAISGALHAGRLQARNQAELQEAQRIQEMQNRKRENQESIRRVMQALGDELEVRWALLDGIYGQEILRAINHSPSPILAVHNRMPVEPFPIYKSLGGRIADLPDADVRKDVVDVYARFEGLVLSIDVNSELTKEYMTALAEDRRLRQVSSLLGEGERIKDARSALKIYFPILTQQYKSTEVGVRELISKLREKLKVVDEAEEREGVEVDKKIVLALRA